MGNGASAVYAPDLLASPSRAFQYIEGLCRSGYFYQPSNADDYNTAVHSAIRAGHLDVLEILLISGNIRTLDVDPLVTAVTEGQLDALELLVSAGFDVARTSGSTCLTVFHTAAISRSEDSGACAAYLALRGGERLARFRSTEGYTAFHLAVQKGNIVFFRYVLPCYTMQQVASVLAMPDREGVLPRQLAVKKGDQELLQVLDQYSSPARGDPSLNRSLSHGARKHVDEARMMAVWEAFFENAMKMMIAREAQEMEKREVCNNGKSSHQTGRAAKSSHIQPEHPWDWNSSLGVSSPQVFDSDSKSNTTTRRMTAAEHAALANEKAAAAAYFWFDHVLLHNSGPNDTDQYYFLRKSCHYDSSSINGAVWLEDHIYHCYQMYPGLTVTPTPTREIAEAHLPHLVLDSMRLGWVTYYDAQWNRCLWLNVHTWRCENSLPLGGDPLLLSVGLRASTASEPGALIGDEEVHADSTVSDSWVLVACEPAFRDRFSPSADSKSILDGEWDAWDEAESEIYALTEKDHQSYYYNRITGVTTYSAPANYDELIIARGGWELVMSADSQWRLYWHHTESGESVWVEAT